MLFIILVDSKIKKHHVTLVIMNPLIEYLDSKLKVNQNTSINTHIDYNSGYTMVYWRSQVSR